MRFLADENVESLVVTALRKAGHDVVWIAEGRRGIPDEEVLAAAVEQERVLLTNDKDFGEMAYRGRQVSNGVVLLRLAALGTAEKARRLLATLPVVESHVLGHLVVIAPDRVRLRPFA